MTCLKPVFTIVALAFLSALASCGKPVERESNLKLSDTEAAGTINARLEKTRKIRNQLKRLSDSMAPIDALLNDLGAAIERLMGEEDLRLSDQPAKDVFRRHRDGLNVAHDARELFHKLGEGVVTYEGSDWVIRRSFENHSCDSSELELRGSSAQGSDKLIFKFKRCQGSEWQTFAEGSLSDQGSIGAQIYPQKIGNAEYRLDGEAPGRCSVTHSERATVFSCADHIEIGSESMRMRFDPFEVVNQGGKLRGSIQVTLSTDGNNPFGTFELESVPGRRAEVRFKKARK